MKEASCNTLRTRPESNKERTKNKKMKKKHKNVVVPRKMADEQVNKIKVLRSKL
jgi:hypothetical protein